MHFTRHDVRSSDDAGLTFWNDFFFLVWQISVGRDVALGGGETFAVDTLIGRRDEPMLELCARRVAGSMANGGCTKALLMGIGLRQHTRESLKAMIDTIEENKVW